MILLMRFSVIFILLITVFSCRNESGLSSSSRKPDRHDMEEINSYFVKKDRERIGNYIERKGLVLEESPTGLWYRIINEGEGDSIRDGQKIIMEYECSLLDGTRCYSSDLGGPKEFILGKTGIEPGLYEGLKMLKSGSEAIFILPPFLAYGLPGDGKKIPPRSVIVYNVHVLKSN